MKYEVTYLIDVVSKNPDDYTIKEIVEAENEIEAIKKVAISMTKKDSNNIEWINNIQGDLAQIKNELLQCNYCFTNVRLVSEQEYLQDKKEIAKNVLNHFFDNYLFIKPKCDSLKLELGEEKWQLMYKMFMPILDSYSKEHICQTKVQAIVGLSTICDTEMDLIFAYSCINERDIEDFKSHLESPIISHKLGWSSNGS